MSSKKNSQVDLEQMASFLKDAVNKVRIDEDPLVLNDYRAVFKKNVPFNLRTYVASYLAAQICGKDNSRNSYHGRNNDSNFGRNRRHSYNSEKYSESRSAESAGTETELQQRPPRVVIPEESAAQIFVGIGKNRHVKPKDLVGLITQVAQIERDRIGSIRTMDNYSFVTLYKEDAEKAIDALNGYSFRGKNLNVAHSIPKPRSEVSAQTSETSVSDGSGIQESEN